MKRRDRNCARCGNAFSVKNSSPQRFCSKSCGAHSSKNKRHGMNGTPEGDAWINMRLRCNNPNHKAYPSYGGRGITICERWDLLENFLEDMGLRPGPNYSLERIDNDGNYEPGNCKWATDAEQTRNRRNSWRPEEDAKLIQAIESGLNFSQASRLLGRSAYVRARFLGLTTNFDPHAPRGPKSRSAERMET